MCWLCTRYPATAAKLHHVLASSPAAGLQHPSTGSSTISAELLTSSPAVRRPSSGSSAKLHRVTASSPTAGLRRPSAGSSTISAELPHVLPPSAATRPSLRRSTTVGGLRQVLTTSSGAI